MADASEFTAVVHRVGCLRGVSTLTGFAIAVDVGPFGAIRCPTAKHHQEGGEQHKTDKTTEGGHRPRIH
jgi:hypothetical protein